MCNGSPGNYSYNAKFGCLSFRCTIIGLTGTLSKENDAKCLEAGMSDILLKPITRKLLLDKVELWMQNKATARKTHLQLFRNKATDKHLQSSNDSRAAYSSKVASMPVQKFKAVVFGNVVLGVCTRTNGLLPQRPLFCSWYCSVLEVTLFVSDREFVVQTRIRPTGWFSRAF